jgi:hypothetical protein
LHTLIETAMLASLIALVPTAATACSAIGCGGNGYEMRRDFVVRVKHDGRALKGVSVRVTGNVENVTKLAFSGMTDFNGMVHVTDLSAGNYWLNIDLLGISAADECFHIARHSSMKARRKATYRWGDDAPATRRIAGRLIDSQPGKGGAPLWNLVHRVEIPISGATLKLQNPVTGEAFSTTSDQVGLFAFDRIPSGTYVLHAEGGRSNRDYDTTDLLIRLSPTATGDSVVLTRRDASGGSCGGTSLELSGVSY